MIHMLKEDDYIGRQSYDYYGRVFAEARDNNHKSWIGHSIPVPNTLLRFYSELKHKRPDIVVRIDKRASGYNGLGYGAFADIGIAYKDAPDVSCGLIGLDMDNGDLQYTVTSKRIKNEKFSTHSSGYNVKKTKNFSNAVKNAMQYIKPFSINDMVDEAKADLDNAMAQIRYPAREKIANATEVRRGDMYEEMQHMIAVGYVPRTEKFTESLALFAAELDELKRIDTYAPKSCMVWLKQDKVEYKFKDEDEVHVALTPQDVPEYIRDKIAVLQIGNSKTAIMDVGVKVSNSLYWVFV